MPIETVRIRNYDKERLVQLYYCRRLNERGYWNDQNNYEGIFRIFSCRGALLHKYRCKNGKKNGHGLVNFFDYEKCYYKNDKLHGKRIFKDDGDPGFSLEYYVKGTCVRKTRQWDEVGNLIGLTCRQDNGFKFIKNDMHISYKLDYESHGMMYDWDDNRFGMYYCIPIEDNVNHCHRIDNKVAWHHFKCFIRKIQKRIRKNSLKKLFDQLTYPRLDEFMIIMSYLSNDVGNILIMFRQLII